MKIAINTIYGEQYAKDKLFSPEACLIGENLLLPNILLKKKLEELDHNFHTADIYKSSDVDVYIFQEIPSDSLLVISSVFAYCKYFLKAKWRTDYLLKAVMRAKKNKRILLVMEPKVVAPLSYNQKFHKYFDIVLTWDDSLVDGEKYYKFFYAQYNPHKEYQLSFFQKKQLVMIAGNKGSMHKNELYSVRRKVIDFFEDKRDCFDLFGFGWEKENLCNYRGFVEHKLDTLAAYKFCVCFENMTGVRGYITEKIFDCFFAGCVPIYWGADNVTEYIPKDTFIDMRKFSSIEEMYQYVQAIDESEYKKYIENAQAFLQSQAFQKTFSVENYINTIVDAVV